MPHLVVEYSSNLDGAIDIGKLCATLHGAMVETGLFELGAIRVRAVRCTDYAIADQLKENAFIDTSLRIGAGRSAEDKKRAGALIFTRMSAALAPQLATPHFALSLEVREIDAALSWKANAIHARLRIS